MILLTGATGKVGSETAKALAARGAQARVLVRDPAKAAALKASGMDIAIGDVADPVTAAKAMAGVTRLLVLLPNSRYQLQLEVQLVDLAKKVGVRHVVKLSSAEAAQHARSPIPKIHWASEEHIRRSGLAWTMLRPGFFMQNLLGSARTIRENRSFSLPMGDGATAMIDTRDIGAAAAEVLTGEGHEGNSYDITGPEVLTFRQVAERFTEALGTRISYIPADPEAYLEMLRRVLPDEWHATAVSELFREIAEGEPPRVTDSIRTLVGRPPISLLQFIRDHRAAFA